MPARRALGASAPVGIWWDLHQLPDRRGARQRIAAASGKNGERLVEIETEWDTGNLFRVNKNIVPRVA